MTIDQISEVVEKHFKLPSGTIKNKIRKREIVMPRQMTMYLAKKYTKHSLNEIAAQVSDQDHATVIYHCRTAQNLIETDKSYRRDIEEIEKELAYITDISKEEKRNAIIQSLLVILKKRNNELRQIRSIIGC